MRWAKSGEARADFVSTKARVLEKHRRLLTSDALARAVVTLRREGVAAAQDAEAQRARLRRDGAGLPPAQRRAASRCARRTSAAASRWPSTSVDFERLHREEATLRRGIDEQIEHLGRTYAEIERLNASIAEVTASSTPSSTAERDRSERVIAAMKATRAWRLHEWWQRIRS